MISLRDEFNKMLPLAHGFFFKMNDFGITYEGIAFTVGSISLLVNPITTFHVTAYFVSFYSQILVGKVSQTLTWLCL